MKRIFWLPLVVPFFMWAMDYTPPKDLPAFMKEKVEELKKDEQAATDVRHHKRHSREHTTVEIHGSVVGPDGKETKLEWKKDGTLEQSGDSDEQKKTYSKSFVIGTNCVSVVCTALIGAGVTLAIKFADCHKD